MTDPLLARRGRPPLPPENRQPRRSGPSGSHSQVSGAELVEQRRTMLADLPLGEPLRDLDPEQALPWGAARRIAEALGRGASTGRQQIGMIWAGKRRYRLVAKIF